MSSALKILFAPLSARVALVASLVLAVLMGTVRLLAIHGPESALVLGVILPPMAAYVAARLVTHARTLTPTPRLDSLLGRAVGFSLVLWLVPALVLALSALRVRNCTPGQGLVFMLLGPGLGVVLASVVGVACALGVRHGRRAAWLASAFPLAGIALALARFYATPAIFAYGHFFGYFPGTLYDEGVSITTPFLFLRVATCAWIAGLCLWLASALDPAVLRLRARPVRGRGRTFALALTLLGLAVLAELHAPELGHASSVSLLRQKLGGELRSERCELVFPRELPAPYRERLGEDCDFRVSQAERWLGLTHPSPITVFFFRSPEEKQALMGAALTNLAKPWRSEVYVHDTAWPHPVLGHELVHVVARGTGSGPLRIAGRAFGLWPDLALIEGVAVAAALQVQGGLTPDEWSRAMLELELLPPLHELFGAGFLGQHKRLAYTASGSVLDFVQRRFGKAALRRAYATGDLEAGTGQSLAEIERAWHAHLRSQPMAASSLALARVRFSGTSIFSALCPHALSELRGQLRGSLVAGDDTSAEHECRAILDIDEDDALTRATRVGVLARLGDEARALAELARLEAAPKAPSPIVGLAKQSLADEAFRRGRAREAHALYTELLEAPNEPDALRLLQVKALAVSESGDAGLRDASLGDRQRALLSSLLVGAPGERSDGAIAVHLIRELRTVRSDGLPHYLEARQLFFQKRFAHAAELLAEAQDLGLPTRELTIEALRLEGMSRFAMGELDRSAALFMRYESTDSASHAAEARDFLQRIAFARSKKR